ncbi:MAG: sn-glycerol-1-phosphate dehydrogenase, partial [Actinobacteria bacterium]|nr:sn-glycerol-1-phosphate dehydrogenase [Actinomycetota bacterium]
MTDQLTDLAVSIQASLEASGDGALRPMGLRRILVGPNALERLPAEVVDVARPGRIVMFEDATPMQRGGDDLKALAASLLSTVGDVDRIVLGPSHGHLYADADTLAVARAAVAGAGCVVTVGSGTVTDIGKDAAHSNPGIPLLVVQSAASVNGFADDMAVIVKDGVKRTVPSVWPSGLLIDHQVLRDAPARLTRSGFAEMMAMFTAPADWRLAAFVGTDLSYSHGVIDLFQPRGEDLLTAAPSVAAGEGAALDLLATLLTASGVAMGVVGRTAVMSGTEHLISHLLDMSAASRRLAVGLHGAQVGVAALVAACIWERILDRLDPDILRSDAAFPDPTGVRPLVFEAFASLDSTGAAAAECWTDYQSKLASWHHHRPRVAAMAERWEEISVELRHLVGDPARMAAALTAVGAPTR